MAYDGQLLEAKLRRWEKYLVGFTLPQWEQLPQLELYMDQVVELVSRCLDFLPPDERGNPPITASTVNNYVRLKMMPPPNKKRYGRVHLAYLIMICTLKQSVSMHYIKQMIPMGLTPQQVQQLYTGYVKKHKETCLYFLEQMRGVVPGSSNSDSAEDMVFSAAVIAGLARLFTEKVVSLQGKSCADFPHSSLLAQPDPPKKNLW